MSRKLFSILCVSLLALISTAAQAKKSLNPKTLTCEEFLELGPDIQERVVYYMEGYDDFGDLIDDVDTEDFGRPIEGIVVSCKQTPKKTLWERIKAEF